MVLVVRNARCGVRSPRAIGEKCPPLSAKPVFRRARNGHSEKPVLHIHSFDDFLEAITRVACLKALPTDADVAASGHPDGGSYLLTLCQTPGAAAETPRSGCRRDARPTACSRHHAPYLPT